MPLGRKEYCIPWHVFALDPWLGTNRDGNVRLRYPAVLWWRLRGAYRDLTFCTLLLLLSSPPPPPLDGRSAWKDDEIDRLEKDVKESYGVMPDFASLAPEVAAEVKH